MNVKLKLAAYAVLVILAIVFGCLFYSSYTAVTKASAAASAAVAAEDSPAPAPAPAPVVTTNVSTNAVAQTNAASSDTNAVVSTNQTAAVSTNAAPTPAPAPKAASPPPETVGKKRGSMIGYLGAFVVVLIGLGLLIAADVTQYMGTRAVDFLFNDKGEGQRNPAYEKAEQVWAQGKHLEAIQMMREYLRDNPREQYVALRIAEIYEKDLKNYLAAALEYEEVLKHKLPPDRWGWSAIHLCNIYSKMNQQDKIVALLQRIVDEYPQTAAAKKARSRLGLEELVAPAAPAAPAEEEVPDVNPEAVKRIRVTVPKGPIKFDEENPEEPEAPPPPAPPKPNLPPGFRPKK